VGFYAKLAVLQAVLGTGQVWLAVVAVLFALVGAFYYIRVVKLMYFDEPSEKAQSRRSSTRASCSPSTGWRCSRSASCRSR